jgi:hypothetical protein
MGTERKGLFDQGKVLPVVLNIKTGQAKIYFFQAYCSETSTKSALSWGQVGTKLGVSEHHVSKILEYCLEMISKNLV